MVREHLSTEQFVYDFLDECAEYMTKIKKCASVQNLSDYWTFLKKYKDGVKNGNNKYAWQHISNCGFSRS